MIKARMGNLVFLGLTKENTERLHNNEPILIKGYQLQLPFDIIISAGETIEDIKKDLRSLGFPIPK